MIAVTGGRRVGAAGFKALGYLSALFLLGCGAAQGACLSRAAGAAAADNSVSIQVLGSGGPELTDQRVSSSYLVRINDRARLLIDAGPGSSANFERSGARLEDLFAVLLTHLHVDHSADLAAYLKGAYFTERHEDLPIYGPDGNERMPATTEFIELLFGPDGAWRYLSDYLSNESPGQLTVRPRNIELQYREIVSLQLTPEVQLQTLAVHHGPIAAIAWRVNIGDCSFVFSGDTSDRYDSLTRLARGADLLIAHHAVPESAIGAAANLHMTPSAIGKIAAEAGVKQLLLSHRMRRTLGREAESVAAIRRRYSGPVSFAESLLVLTFAQAMD